ncbi:hypothetical protein BDZ97DRAFT_2074317 [Flammula alnicola]|nr:hypothetical protein BDZ97DRAFT_2074317 [Flammula alnicola]
MTSSVELTTSGFHVFSPAFELCANDQNLVKKEILRSREPLPEVGIYLLSKILDADLQLEKTVDLSGFHLTDEQVVDLLSLHSDVGVLKVSHNNQINIDIVVRLLSQLPSLRRFVVWNTAITDDDVMLERKPDFFRRSLEGFIDPAFTKVRDGFDESKLFAAPISFTQICHKDNSARSISLPYFASGRIAQALTDYLSAITPANLHESIDQMEDGQPVIAAYLHFLQTAGHLDKDMR